MQKSAPVGQLDWRREEEFLQSVFMRSHSVHSRHFYESGLRRFKVFCREEKVGKVSNGNVYDVINSFVRWNDARGIRAKTIVDYVCSVKRFLLYQDVEIEENRFRNKVLLPRAMRIDDRPLSVEVIRRLLSLGRPNRKMLALILTLASSGMRLAEAMNLRVGDLELEGSPASARIKAEYSKTRRERMAFVSDEAREALRPLVAGAQPERLVFDYWGDIWQREKNVMRTFAWVRERARLNEKFEDYRSTFRRVHFHLFRKFFLTRASDVIGEHAAHALCGHGFYMDTYYRKSEEERREDYVKLMPHLTILSQARPREEEMAERVKREMLIAVGYSQKEVGELDIARLGDEGVQRMIRERLLVAPDAPKGDGQKQKVVGAREADRWIGEGWEWIGNLADGRAVLRRLPT